VNKDKKDFFSKIFHSDGKGGLLNDDNIVTEKVQFIVKYIWVEYINKE